MKTLPSPRTHSPGFSLLELLVVASLCAVVFTSGSLAYRAIAQNQRRASTFQQVTFNATVAANLFGAAVGTTIDSYSAPNYGRATLANQMRNLFYEDVETGTAVFALPRGYNPNAPTAWLNNIRERVIPIGTRLPADYDTPAKFAGLLTSLPATTARAGVFANYRGAPPATLTTGAGATIATNPLTNGSVFILQPSGSTSEIWVRAVYDIDYIPYLDTSNSTSIHPTGTPCVHASVRRYVNSVLTHFYDVIYNDATLNDVGVPFVHFERAVRTNVPESAAITKYKTAANQPFYLMWWPDPAMARLRGTGGTYLATTPQADYAKHEGQTSFTFTVPQFPCF
jgi:type II secretory pathway pseudopilin PulG